MATILDNSEHKALTTLARAKSFMGVSGDSEDTVITILINQATGFIESFLNRNLLSQTYTEQEYDGTGTDTLVLKHQPVTAFSKLEVNTSGDSTASWQEIQSKNYFWYENGIVELNNPTAGFLDQDAGKFLPHPKKYRATYTAGYLIDFANENDPSSHTLPLDIEYACMKLVSAMRNARKGEGLQSAQVGDIRMSFRSEVMKSAELKEILGKYASYAI